MMGKGENNLINSLSIGRGEGRGGKGRHERMAPADWVFPANRSCFLTVVAWQMLVKSNNGRWAWAPLFLFPLSHTFT